MNNEKGDKPTRILNKKVKAQNRHWKNFVDKNYLGSHNLEKGEEMLLTIERFEGEENVKGADGKESVKQVLYFKEQVPKMIMNITNGNTISSLYGTHPDQWVGKQIQVYATAVNAFGKTQDALRIRDFVPSRAIDIEAHYVKMQTAKSAAELKTIWSSFSASARNDINLIFLKDELKKSLN